MDTSLTVSLGPQFDLGNFWAWQTSGCNWFLSGYSDSYIHKPFRPFHLWTCMVLHPQSQHRYRQHQQDDECTQEEKLILGQLYFFRLVALR